MALEALGEQDSVLRVRVLSSLARALIFAGREERGIVVGRAAIAMARRMGDTSALLVALKAVLHTAVGPALLHERLIQDALEMHTRMGAKPWLAHTQHEYARMLLARRSAANASIREHADRDKAVSLLSESLHTSHVLGMRALEARIMTLQEQLQPRPKRVTTYPEHLTEREVAVLRLIAAGETNREISQQLCISLRTVATHVTHIFNKIVVVNRAEAAAYAIRHGLA